MYRIWIVEDDEVIASAIKKAISSWGFEVQCATNFRDLIPEFVEFDPQLVLLDISLPFYNGYHWCSEIRKISKVPIIFISSASDSLNIVMAVNMGADDFVTKPFDLSVLTAKIQALLRRTYDFAGGSHVLEHRGALLNISDATLTYQGERMELTRNELKILQLLLENKGRVVSREAIMTRLWETDSYVDDNTLTVNITRILRKLEQLGLPDLITKKRALGYMVE